MARFITHISVMAGQGDATWYPLAQQSNVEVGAAVFRMLFDSFERPSERARLPATDEPLAIEVLYCGQVPCIRMLPARDQSTKSDLGPKQAT